MSKKDSEELLLEMVIEYFIKNGSPVWSKFLFNLEDIDIAPSTIRKYLNMLEKKWLVYQPYSSSWRLPTKEWMNKYVLGLLETEDRKAENVKNYLLEKNKKYNLRWFVESLWQYCDWVVFWFYEDDIQMHYLGITKILKKVDNDIEQIIPLMDFIEQNEVISYIWKKVTKDWDINYSLLNYNWWNIWLMYIKLNFEWKDSIIWVLSSLRADYKSNIKILKKILDKWIF